MAYPYNTENGTVSAPQILLYGTTSDNSSFLIQEAGIGSRGHQNTRIVSRSAAKVVHSAYTMLMFPSPSDPRNRREIRISDGRIHHR
jgi:hypothetical protein